MTDIPSASHDRLRAAAAEMSLGALDELCELVRIPSVAFDGFDATTVRRSAAAVAEIADSTGLFDRVDVLDAEIPGSDERGMPAVLAVRKARGAAPTVLLYAHHDVQPSGDDALWDSPPFEPELRGGRLYGRGTADDKAGFIAHMAALRALASVSGPEFGLGVVVFVEGEEEAGSRSFPTFLAQHADDLRADVVVVADSSNGELGVPALTVSLRGTVRFTLRVRTLAHASHSGMFGGAVPDAMTATILLLATFWDGEGSVVVDGLTSDSGETPDDEGDRLRREAGLLPGVQPVGRGPILDRLWNQPSITVTGIDAPGVLTASNTLSPEISVVVSARTAPGQSAQDGWEALRAHLLTRAPFGAAIDFTDVQLGDGIRIDRSGWAMRAAREALAVGFGAEPVDIGLGGSIPFVSDLVRAMPDARIIVTGVQDPGSAAHSPNESLDVETFRSAVLAETLLLARLDERGGDDDA